jgi:uncharacterized membrane protein YdfJ with MMPL/SSD domain
MTSSRTASLSMDYGVFLVSPVREERIRTGGNRRASRSMFPARRRAARERAGDARRHPREPG